MANLFSVTAPLTLRFPDGKEQLVAELYKHPKGLLYFDLYWHLKEPEEGIHLIKGWIDGNGPWKISDHILRVLACHNKDGCLADEFNHWQNYRLMPENEYPPRPMIDAIAMKLGAEMF